MPWFSGEFSRGDKKKSERILCVLLTRSDLSNYRKVPRLSACNVVSLRSCQALAALGVAMGHGCPPVRTVPSLWLPNKIDCVVARLHNICIHMHGIV